MSHVIQPLAKEIGVVWVSHESCPIFLLLNHFTDIYATMLGPYQLEKIFGGTQELFDIERHVFCDQLCVASTLV